MRRAQSQTQRCFAILDQTPMSCRNCEWLVLLGPKLVLVSGTAQPSSIVVSVITTCPPLTTQQEARAAGAI